MLSAAGLDGASTSGATAAFRIGRFGDDIWMNRVSRLMP
ncbi:hypothetical protein LILAB_22380 [Corallococcus macrosporus]|uniref:Uncharacterized protein n=1 Tax=Myxococcus fulvus (strain ATCC BAA-855 / HW-1) TaxID=483219 RepID=F8CJZ5_MYXFH|nr:hypothetical protein LILAB_22380 [Corallococcus macrosporus]